MKTEKRTTSISALKNRTIYKTLVSPKYHTKLIAAGPHRVWNDLVILYRIELDDNHGAFINYEAMDALGYTETDLYRISIIPTPKYKGLIAMMMELMGNSDPSFANAEEDAYVLTAKDNKYGAACLLDTNFLKANIKGEAYIIPSSIHEVIVHPVKKVTARKLNQMVNEVNTEVVEASDRLGDHIYYWNGKEVTMLKGV